MGTAVSSVDSLTKTLKTLLSKEFLPICDFDSKSQIDHLLHTILKVKALFLQADNSQELSEQQSSWIMHLKHAVFEANRWVDNTVILAERIQLVKDGASLSKNARLFCSRLNPIWVAYGFSQEAQKIRNNLDGVVSSFDIDPIQSNMTHTLSYVNAADIIGREDDLKKMVSTLLVSSGDNRNVYFYTIVGFGGLGKTALAQVVFNDPEIVSAFDLRAWACCSYSYQDQFNVRKIMYDILSSVCGIQFREDSSIEELQYNLARYLEGRKYLIVLDDVQTENRSELLRLEKYLIGGRKGSWIVVTTCSRRTAEIMGDGQVHVLDGLSEENSWKLFKNVAFGTSNQPDDLVKIGREIIDGCARLPRAIKIMGSLLYGQDKSKWQSVQKSGLAASTMDIHRLEFPLKSCLSYCALFPNEFEIQKEQLKYLWMAQDYVVPSHEDQSVEEACEEYFSNMVDRNFFQDIKIDKYSQVVSCKIHEIVHGISKHIAGKEMCVMNTVCHNIETDVLHLSVVGVKFDEFSLGKTHLLSYLHFGYNGFQVKKSYLESLIANCQNLKTLDLSELIFKSLPDSVGELSQLRYLNMSGNTELESLPKSVTELRNLQTLIIRRCCTLKELPKDLGRLANLRLLDIRSCSSLTCMPRGMRKLTGLHNLSDYIVGGENWNQWFDGLDDLVLLHNLRGCLNIHIRWPKDVNYVVERDLLWDGLCLDSMEHLTAVLFDFIHDEVDGSVGNEEAIRLMGMLHPHPNLKYLEVKKYHGLRMPDWVTLPLNLVELHLTDCKELVYLPCLRNLLHLEVLKLINLGKLERIGEDSPSANSSFTPTLQLSSIQELSFIHSLRTLELRGLLKLKGWRQEVEEDDDQLLGDGSNSNNKSQLQKNLCFYILKSLVIWNCPELTCLPLSLRIKDLKLFDFNSRLQMIIEHIYWNDYITIASASSSSWAALPKYSTAIMNVTTSNAAWLNSLPKKVFQFLENLDIWGDKELGSLGEAGNVFLGGSSSLRNLIIRNCSALRSVVPVGLEHLTTLENLEIRDCNNLSLSEQQEEGGEYIGIGINLMPLSSNLHTLTLHGLPQLVNLPSWMQFLPALQSLSIAYCNQLKSMPNWMPKLVSLTHLTVSNCSIRLKKRCQESPQGEDWPYIHHIQIIKFKECFY